MCTLTDFTHGTVDMQPDRMEPPHQGETTDGAEQQQSLRVYLRVRPFSKDELYNNEDQGCITIENSQTVTLNAPKGSATMKSSERGIGLPLHKFTFSQIFGPETMQAELFEDTIKSQVSDYLEGKNALIFSYGVTNAGKSYTIQGTPKEPGLLPRVLDATFQYIRGQQYEAMDLKPYLSNDAQYLGPDQVKRERSARAGIFSSFKEDCDAPRASGSSDLYSTALELSFSNLSFDETGDLVAPPTEPGCIQFALWVAFFEIYNESVYDLLQPPSSKSKKRCALRVCEDSAGNAYVRDLKWINIQNFEEASKLLRFGNKNRSAAATKMNQSSSRRFSLCDLAGSERCTKTKTFGERLKEAGNINNSLLTLGKCITALRNNQTDRMKSSYIPFRESKLTKLFQAVFCGKGRASMIVNINQCSSTYDETLHVMKFSAVAKQVVQVIPTKSLESLAPRLVGRDGRPLLKDGVIDDQALDDFLSEDELLDEEDEADMSILPQEELVNLIDRLRSKLLAEQRKNLVQEIEIRKEMGDAMLQQLMESEELRSRQMAELKENHQEELENTFEFYKDAFKEHAYQCARERLEDEYVPLDELTAEQEKVESLRRKVSELETLMSDTRPGAAPVPMLDQSCQTSSSRTPSETDAAGDDRHKLLYKEKCALEKMCADKQELILALEKRLAAQNETLQKVRDDFLQTAAQLEALQGTAGDQTKAMHDLLRDNADKEKEIASLKAEVAALSQKSPVQPKKRSLLANIRESVTSPRNGPIGRSLRSTRSTSLKNKLSN